jgi:O-antigen/teichoic acid export membrane protein
MSQENYGLYTTYYSVVVMLVPFVGANLFVGLNNGYFDFRENRKQFRASVLFLSFIVFICLSFVLVVLTCIFNKISTKQLSVFVLIMALLHSYSFFVVNYYNNFANMENKYKVKSILMMLPNVLQVLFSILLIYCIKTNAYYERVIGSAAGVFVCAIVLFVVMLAGSYKLWNKEYYLYVLRLSIPSILSSISYIIMQQSDHIMITEFVGAEFTAVYGLVYCIGNILYAFLQSTSGAFQSWAYHALDSGNYIGIKLIQKWYLVFYLVISIGLLMIAPEIIKILAPSSYWDFRYIPPFLAGSCMLVLNSFYSTVGEFYKKAGKVSLCVAAAALSNIVLNFIFIPKYGAIAAAYTSFVSYIFLVLLGRILIQFVHRGLYSDRLFLMFSAFIILICILFIYVCERPVLRYCSYSVVLVGLCYYAYLNQNEILGLVRKDDNT